MKQIWVEKYRPKAMSEYVWRDDRQRYIVETWVKEKNIPHILLSGSAGTGKSSIINVLLHELGVQDGDILYKNASEETSVDMVRDAIINFASTIPWGDFKVCILEEADALSRQAQNSLKRVIEDFSDTCRFIFTTNNPHKIDPAIHSRCQGFHVESLKEEDYLLRLAFILDDNDITYDADTLISYVKGTMPDLRKAINLIHQNSKSGTLLPPSSSDNKNVSDYMVKATEMFRKGQIQQGRELLVENASYEEYVDIYRFLYKNLEFWSKDREKQEEALLIIRDGLYKDSIVADREINLSATLVQLKNIQ